MKCIKNGNEIRRVKDKIAINLVSKGGSPGWAYCPKSEWKKIRGKINTIVDTSTESPVTPKKHKDNSKGKDYKRKKSEKRFDKAEKTQ